MPDAINANQRTAQEWTHGNYMQENNLARITNRTLDRALQRGTQESHSLVVAHRLGEVEL